MFEDYAKQYVTGVVTKDTGKDISDITNKSTFYPFVLTALMVAESDLTEHAERIRNWPDQSAGLTQPAVKWFTKKLPGLTYDAQGLIAPTAANVDIVFKWCKVAENLLPYTGPHIDKLMDRWDDPLEALCRYNKPSVPGSQNPNRANYIRGLNVAMKYVAEEVPDMTIVDMRGRLAVNHESSYQRSSLSLIRECDIHYTASSPNSTVEAIAAYQTSEAARQQTGAGVPFPGIAYTYVVPLDGHPRLCHDLEVRTWHNSAPGRNTGARAICWIGHTNPSVRQITGIAEALIDMEKRLGRQVDAVRGHKDTNSTSCPGPGWPSWKPAVLAEYNRLKGGNEGEENPGWQEPGFAEMWRQNKSLMGTPTTEPYPYGADDVRQDSAKGTAIWVKASNRNFFLPLDSSLQPISI